jgi:hypothetical protein
MADAKKMQMRVDFDATTNDGKKTIFRANGSVITFPGFLPPTMTLLVMKTRMKSPKISAYLQCLWVKRLR